MNKIQEIFTAWAIAFDPTQEQSELASERIQICNECEFKNTIPIIHCGECGCALKAKVYSPVIGACPKGKWVAAEMKWENEKNKKRYDNLK